uniref:NR LBD domain-containing protein n=1 Tax=Panagrolaimus sp. ES5 TaxID=591445 RepID=A0AC34GP31_9BILA
MLKSDYNDMLSKDILTEERINTCPKEKQMNTFFRKSPAMNVEKVYQEVKSVLEQESKCFTALDNFNITKKFAEALLKFCEKPNEARSLTENADHGKRMEYYEKYLVDVSKLLTNIEYFSALSFPEKFALYKRFWQKFQILEKCFVTFLYFGNNQDDMRYIVGQDNFIDINSKQYELQQTQTETAVFLFPMFDKTKLLLRHIKKTGITIFEFSYICQLLLWSCAEIEEITPQTCKLADEMLQKASDELHDYYVNEIHMLNYAARQAELIKHVRLTEVMDFSF